VIQLLVNYDVAYKDWVLMNEWYKEGNRHRGDDLPAVEYSNGVKKWYKNGKLHRENDLPAVEYPNGSIQMILI
jgi:hypothetical protein